jgi:hypothetical protein
MFKGTKSIFFFLVLAVAGCATALEPEDFRVDVAPPDSTETPEGDGTETLPDIETDKEEGEVAPDPGGCTFHSDCDNALYCDGTELCVGGVCQPGTPPVCNDLINCTVDSCDESTKDCLYAPDNALCDDGKECNGVETCAAGVGCVPGSGATCDDGVDCTWDDCDLVTGACSHEPEDYLCEDDGLYCNGTETCDLTRGCLAGGAPDCSADDGIACTREACDEEADACAHTPDDTLCSDGNVCNGREVCTPSSGGCTTVPETCDDTDACTIDTCDAGANACVNTLIDGDGDTWPPSSCGGPDCDDGNPSINPAAAEVCDDGADNDCNGRTDAADYACCGGDNDTCACPLDVSAGGTFTGTTSSAANDTSGGCGGSSGSDRVFYLHLDGRADVAVSTVGSSFDTILYVRRGTCTGSDEVGCDDDGGGGLTSLVSATLDAGDYFIFVDGYGSGSGSFQLNVTVTPRLPPVTGNDQCGGAADASAGGCFNGDTSTMTDDYDPTCGSSGGKDVVFTMTLASARTVRLATYGSDFDTLLSVRQGACTGTETVCDDDGGSGVDSLIERSFSAGTWFVFVDGYGSSSEGSYALCVTFP